MPDEYRKQDAMARTKLYRASDERQRGRNAMAGPKNEELPFIEVGVKAETHPRSQKSCHR